jgi:valyl-tRNA synthetase
MKERLSNWIDSLGWDWCISRQRYFATAIPLWLCQKEGCDGVVLADEKQAYVDPTVVPPPVKQCPKCGGPLKGCEDVFDTWMDSSLSALFCCYWERDEKRFKQLFPMSLRPQSHDIIRTWAFYTLIRTYQLMEDLPWKDIVISGFIMAPDGRPMHTSLGNVVDPLPLLDKYGADGMRFFAGTCSLGKDQPFQEKEVVHGRRLAEKVYNIGKFIGNALKDHKQAPAKDVERAPLDRWILARFSRTIKEVTEAMDEYSFDRATRALEAFIWHEFADHYLELVKHRVYGKKDPSALATLYEVGQGMLTMLCFIQPHITEEVYQSNFKHLTGAKSIALTSWPKATAIDEECERKGELVKDITAGLRSFKAEKKMALNAPLPKVQLVSELDLGDMVNDIKGATNAASVVMTERGDLKEVPGEIKPVKAKIGPEFKAKAGLVMEALKKEDPAKLAKSLETGKVKLKLDGGEEVTIGPEHAEVVLKWTIKGKAVDLFRVGDVTVLVERP